MKFIIIGLGNYGSILAKGLTQMGHEVIGVDNRKARVEELRDSLSSTIWLDSAEVEALQSLPLNQVDMVIVAIGENFSASIHTVALLRQLGVKNITARALSSLNRSVLQALGVQRVIFPEQEAALVMARSFDLNGFESSFRVDDTHYVLRFAAPSSLVGKSVARSGIAANGMQLLTIVQRIEERNAIGVLHNHEVALDNMTDETLISSGDVLVVYATLDAYNQFAKSIKE